MTCLLVAVALPAEGQERPGRSGRRCQLEILNVDREGRTIEVQPGSTNYFAGGNVRARCLGQNVRMRSDSLASYQGAVVYLIGDVEYVEDSVRLTTDFWTYHKQSERWEARGNVVYTDRSDGSTLKGPALDYFRRVTGVRDTAEVYAFGRPVTQVGGRDSTGRVQEPYTVVSDRLRMRGEDRLFAGGNVTIDRSDLAGRSDSLELDTGAGSRGALVGRARLERRGGATVQDSFALSGKRIDLALKDREVTFITGRDSAALRGRDLDLRAGMIGLDLEAQSVRQTLAWGRDPRPVALADEYEVRGDSIAVDTPEETLRELRAFGRGWVGLRPDTAKGERDWLAGDTIVASFGSRDSAPGERPALRRLEARGAAQSFYRVDRAGTLPSITSMRARRIVLIMAAGDSAKVERVEAEGEVDGIQLEPEAVRRDTTRADTARAAGRRPPPRRPDE